MSVTVYLALGSNLGDRLVNLQQAINGLPPAVCVQAVSPVYETPPWGVLDQPAYLNQALRAETGLSPDMLLAYLKQLEQRLGRVASIRFGPRLIDLDILFYGNLELHTPQLELPHPRLAERAFVLVPLADLAAELVHPVLGKTVRQMLAEVDRQGIVRYSTGQDEHLL